MLQDLGEGEVIQPSSSKRWLVVPLLLAAFFGAYFLTRSLLDEPLTVGSLTDSEREINRRARFRDYCPSMETPSDPIRVSAGPTSDPKNPCASAESCTLVPIFFGTNRQFLFQLREPEWFSADRSRKLCLGRALVTVPKSANRRRGEIPRPNYWDLYALATPLGGDPRRHFTIPFGGISLFRDAYEMAAEIRRHYNVAGEFRDHAFIFIHGYNTTFEHALHRAAQIAFDLGVDGEAFGTAHLYSWPSGGGLADYPYDFDSARLAVEHLREYLELVVGMTPTKNVHIIAHSMGAWLLMSALKEWNKSVVGHRVLNQIILAAPDIDIGEFEKLAANVHQLARGVTLYASQNDLALWASIRFHRGTNRAGFVSRSGPAIFRDIDSIDITAIGTDVFSNGHSEYVRKEVLNDIALLFRKGERPPHARTPMLERVKQSELEYWRYPK
ncbi:MAG: alpha/beta hydrolase [Hyphomicrobiaceae bacterium]